MRVLQILGCEKWGGEVEGVHAVTRALLSHGHDVWVVTTDEPSAHRFELLGTHVLRPPGWFRWPQPADIVPFLYLWRLCRRTDFDLVITHGWRSGLVGRPAARLAGAPHVVHHTRRFWNESLRYGPRRRIRRFLEQQAERSGDLTIANSAQLRTRAIDEGICDPARTITILDGVATEESGSARPSCSRHGIFPSGLLALNSSDTFIGTRGSWS